MRRKQKTVILVSILVLTFAGGCKKKAPVAAAPPPPQAPAVEPAKPSPPTIALFMTDPSRIEQGQTAELRWQVRDATQIEIDQGIRVVATSGHRQIGPAESTTYTLAAKGPGGEASADASLSVTLPPQPRLL
jgi:PBP1b-binding outer membrane lipoprotein LpoB